VQREEIAIMIDTMTHERLEVLTAQGAGPYIMLPFSQLESVKSILKAHAVPFWEDSFSVSINGDPAMITINLYPGVDAAQVQRLLDAVE
jgi:hypothetical protein